MKAWWIVTWREIAERRRTLLLALGAGVPPLLVPFLPGSTAEPFETCVIAAFLLTATMGLAYALALGQTIFVRDLAEHRMGFFFSRPLPAAAIWSGKIMAAWLLALGAAILSAIPTLLAGGIAVFSEGRRPGTHLAVLAFAIFSGLFWGAIVSLVAILLLHVAASVVRLRSPWLPLDALLFAVVVSGTWLSIRQLRHVGIFYDPWGWVLPVLALLLVILLPATYVQIAQGRADARRSHGALSVTLWGLSTAAVALLGTLALWHGLR